MEVTYSNTVYPNEVSNVVNTIFSELLNNISLSMKSYISDENLLKNFFDEILIYVDNGKLSDINSRVIYDLTHILSMRSKDDTAPGISDFVRFKDYLNLGSFLDDQSLDSFDFDLDMINVHVSFEKDSMKVDGVDIGRVSTYLSRDAEGSAVDICIKVGNIIVGLNNTKYSMTELLEKISSGIKFFSMSKLGGNIISEEGFSDFMNNIIENELGKMMTLIKNHVFRIIILLYKSGFSINNKLVLKDGKFESVG